MKKTQLDRRLRALGWWVFRQGGRHELWTNGEQQEVVPRHKEINEKLARKILRTAEGYPANKRQ